MCTNIIEMIGITKKFANVIANDNVNFFVRENEVHALLGENGAGKSTLMSILFGSYEADSGIITLRGDTVVIRNPNDATTRGIGMVHQHFKLVHNYTVTENIILGMEPRNRFGMIDMASAERRVAKLSKLYGLNVDLHAKIEDISVGMQQRVEILKTLYRNADILIFDEPTAVLTPQEIDELMEIIRVLKKEGKTIILITHKLKEIKAVADRCTVLRRGKYRGTVDVSSVTTDQLAEMMVGRAVNLNIPKKTCKPGNEVLRLSAISTRNTRGNLAVKNFSLSVHEGEIVGIAGVDGNGQTELIYAITGLIPCEHGQIFLSGQDITKFSIKKRIEAGIGHIPEDRQKHGLISSFTVAANCALKNFDTVYSTPAGILKTFKMNEHAANLITEFDIRTGEGALTLAGNMSGGNQQKMIIAREINLSPKLLVIAQPTRGLDVGAIEYIRTRIISERDKGRAILLLSLELDEIMNLCDRIVAISRGEIAGIFTNGKVTEREIGALMAGTKTEVVNAV